MTTQPSDAGRLPCQRAAFDLPEELCWLNSAYLCPLLHSVKAAGIAGLERRARPWEISSRDFFEPAERVRELFAGLIGGDADGIAIVPSVSYGIGVATRNLPLAAGETIVVVEEQFPSNIYPWRRVAQSASAEIRTVPLQTGDWTDAILSAIDHRTAVVSIPAIHWTTGIQFDLDTIGKRAREQGAALIVDATQSLGVLPFDVRKLKPDFLVAAAYKSLLGPYGITYLYAHPKWRSGEPLEEGWLNRRNASDFSQLTHYCDDYAEGARRYDFGERANSILLPMAIASLQQLTAWQPRRIEQYTRPLIDRIIERASVLGLPHPPRQFSSPCMVGVGLAASERSPAELAETLAASNIHVSIRKRNARVAVHVHNSRDDIDRLFDTLAGLL